MPTPLVPIHILSIYKSGTTPARVALPSRMALCTADTMACIIAVAQALEARGGKLYLSDLFRSYDMQLQSHQDYVNGKKKAFSPAPGGSLHEAGRALDLDLAALKISLADFWELAKPFGMTPIIKEPKSGVSESWHFDVRGSHQIVYDYYKAGKGNNFKSPYTAMAASAILAIGVRVDKFANQQAAYLQSCLVRLGYELGSIDGAIGTKTRQALIHAGINQNDFTEAAIRAVEVRLKERFPTEW